MRSPLVKDSAIRLWVGNLVILFAYSFGALQVAMYSDDYTSMIFTSGMSDHALSDLRPGQAVLVQLGFATIANNPQDIWKLKCLSLLGLLMLYNLVISRIAQRYRSWFVVLGIAVGFCITPFQMYIHWATCWYFTWVGVIALVSYHFYRKKGHQNKALGLILLMGCISTYPIMAYSFIVFCCVISLINEAEPRLLIKEFITQIRFVLGATVISIIFGLLILQSKNLESSSRVGIVTLENIPEKLFWLVSRPLIIGLRPFQISSPSTIGALLSVIPVVLLISLYLILPVKETLKVYWQKVFLIGLIIVVSLAPLIITSDNQFEFRLIPSYGWLIVVLLFLGLEKVAHLRRYVSGYTNLLATSLVIIAIVTANLTYYSFFLNPYRAKTNFISQALSNCQEAGRTASVVILRPSSNFPNLANLGVLSQSTDLMSDWVPAANVKVVSRSLGLKLGEVTYLTGDVPRNRATCYVDLEVYRSKIVSNL